MGLTCGILAVLYCSKNNRGALDFFLNINDKLVFTLDTLSSECVKLLTVFSGSMKLGNHLARLMLAAIIAANFCFVLYLQHAYYAVLWTNNLTVAQCVCVCALTGTFSIVSGVSGRVNKKKRGLKFS